MEKDNQLKEILLKGSEIASADFTDAIMKRVKDLSPTPVYYQPLVSEKTRKAFIYIFATLASFILLLALMISLADITFISSIEVPKFSINTYYKALVFILSFWLVFAINAFVQKHKLKAS